MTTNSDLWGKLNDPEYRKAFVASQINFGIPFQIRALMKARGWTQEQLAEKTEMRQPSISGLITPGKTRPNIETLRRLAEAFDCGLAVRFVPFSDLVKWSDKFDPDSFAIADFHEDRAEARTEEISREFRQSMAQKLWEWVAKRETPDQDLPAINISEIEQKIVRIDSNPLFGTAGLVDKRDMAVATSNHTEMKMRFSEGDIKYGS